MEAWDAIPQNAGIMSKYGVNVSINSDSDERIRRLYQEAARALHYMNPGEITEDEALRWITINPAMQLGIDNRVGSLEAGKDADIAIFSAHPFSSYTTVEMTLIDGQIYFDRAEDLKNRPQGVSQQ
jgi:imidazolonepropionase-like amidohydrolase